MRSVLLLLIPLVAFSVGELSAQEITNSVENSCSICINGMHLEGTPYDFQIKNEWPFLAVGAISLATGIIAQNINHPTAFTEAELMNLDRHDIFFIDRGAANNWSRASATASDVVISTSILLPTFFFDKPSYKKRDFHAFNNVIGSSYHEFWSNPVGQKYCKPSQAFYIQF